MGFYYIPHKLILHSSSCTFHTCLMRIDQNITRISVPPSSFYHWDINYSFCQFRNIVFNLISVYPFPIGMISQAFTAFDKTLLGPGGGWVQSWNSRSTKDLNDQTNNRMENETSTEISWFHGLITYVLCLFNIV